MNGMNLEWAVHELDSFIHLAERIPHPSANVIGTVHRGSGSDLAAQAQIVEQILDRATPGWREALPEKGRQWAGLREAASRGRAQLQREDELRQNLGDDAPEISASNLHPWIWSGARSLWQSGHFVQAVRDAATKLNAETQNKVGRRDVSETDLFKQSFSLDEAKTGKARLRRLSPEDSDTYRSVQRGAMAFAEGVFAGIRNPLSHEADQEMSEQVALEHLAALSVLARWVDESTVEHAGEPS
ncbi:TIGR02391 family protein [Ruania rhizosphaerae]|uniref:TIGR02391 family protein n=1 Tax=Ruania rhizosphaerae TaxID=1840413 RepID=UPI001356C422|nr:TIGR02391 family protein [Ruania rhizosphaerae]